MHIKPRKGLKAGDILDGQLTLLEHVAEGGMGSIFRAAPISGGDHVAVKLLHKRFIEDSEAVERFMREAQTISALSHPGIIRVFSYGFDEANNELYLVMEWLDGDDVDDIILREGALDPRYAAWVALQVARCLSYAHEQGVIHRDLKPENIFITPGPTPAHDKVRVLDFGIAKVLNNPNQLEITRVGIVCGTPEYMSPEQARAGAVDGRADLYSLGCVLFAMVTGRPPFSGTNPINVMIQQQTDPLPPMPDEVPAQLQDIIRLATQKRPDQRQRSLKVFARQLVDFLNAQPTLSDASDVIDLGATGLESASAARISSTATPKLTPELVAAERARLAAGGPSRVASAQAHKLTADQVAEAVQEADRRISSGSIPKLNLNAIPPAPAPAPAPAPTLAPAPTPAPLPAPTPAARLATTTDRVLWGVVALLVVVVVALLGALIVGCQRSL